MCEDDFYSKTGVCIGCDAGLCKNFFHVTWSGVKIVHGPSIFSSVRAIFVVEGGKLYIQIKAA